VRPLAQPSPDRAVGRGMPVLSGTGMWITFACAAAAILLFDFFFLARMRKRISPKHALMIVAAYVVVALGFGGLIFSSRGSGPGMEYLAAYLIEQSLSFDNIFVWALIFKNLSVADEHQEKVLFWGIFGAILFRAGFIFGGAALLNLFDWVLYLFGAIVIVSGIRLLRSGGDQNIENSRIMKFARAHLPVTKDFKGRRFLVRRGGSWCGTPLLLAVVVIELTDVFFALDSIPAIFGVTRDTLIIYTSNIFAVIGLRALYFAIAGLMERLRYLHYGLAVLLVLIGIKMIAGNIIEIPIWITLSGTLAIIAGTIGTSLVWSRPKPASA
jgi:tellurite resistance protein TerC